jgi:hypothetical protein
MKDAGYGQGYEMYDTDDYRPAPLHNKRYYAPKTKSNPKE